MRQCDTFRSIVDSVVKLEPHMRLTVAEMLEEPFFTMIDGIDDDRLGIEACPLRVPHESYCAFEALPGESKNQLIERFCRQLKRVYGSFKTDLKPFDIREDPERPDSYLSMHGFLYDSDFKIVDESKPKEVNVLLRR